MRIFSKISRLAVTLALLVATLASCGFYESYKFPKPDAPSADGLTTVTDPTAPTAPEVLKEFDFGLSDSFAPSEVLKNFHAYDLEKVYFSVATTSMANSLFDTVYPYTDAVMTTRNEALENAFNFKFAEFDTDIAALIKSLANAEKTGDGYANIVAVPLSELEGLEETAHFSPLDSLPFVDKNADYFKANSLFGIESEFFVAGSASVRVSDTYVLYFNKNLLKKTQASELYSLISPKKWTWDEMSKIISAENGAFACNTDLYSLIYATILDEIGEDSLYPAKAETLAANIGKYLILDDKAEEKEETEANAEDGEESENPEEGEEKPLRTAKEKFLSGEALFYFGKLGEIEDFFGEKDNFGLMPTPLFSEGDNYSSLRTPEEVTVFACPKSATDTSVSAFMISAINASSEGMLEKAYFTLYDGSFLTDNGSYIALGHICGSELRLLKQQTVDSEQ